ncbi:sortase [Candidatus Saccharibacteria bacterium]|nr:sortase [Candidatus Saccharibacteria bacterium]
MELRKRLNSKNVFVVLYVLAFFIYIIYGLQPAEAVQNETTGELNIPSIGLVSNVTDAQLKNNELEVPDLIVGSFSNHTNKTLLIGHSTTVFSDLDKVQLRDSIIYNGKKYTVKMIDIMKKSKISMRTLLDASVKDTIVIMTCAGKLLDNGDATHRLIITASV